MKKGFTLVELMIVVAIIGILAAIAIPNFVEMQYRAKRAEAPACVDGIKTAEAGYEATNDQYLAVAATPSAPSGKSPAVWPTTSDFNTLGWKPDGNVRGAYEVQVNSGGAGDFTAKGSIDVDGDGSSAIYTATKSINTVATTANNIY